MAYCTLDDIRDMMDEEEIIRYTDDHDQGIINTNATDKAISGADAYIDSLIASRYSVPVLPVPDIILGYAVDIAIYKIYTRRGRAAPEGIRNKYDDAVKWLEKVAAGKAKIPGIASAPSGSSGDSVSIDSSDRKFSRDSLKGF